jgi:hypothetical protein
MKPLSIAVVCLLLAGGGLVLLCVIPRPSHGPHHSAGLSISQAQTGSDRVPPSFVPIVGRGFESNGDPRNSGGSTLRSSRNEFFDGNSQSVSRVTGPTAARGSLPPTVSSVRERSISIHAGSSPDPNPPASAQARDDGTGPPITVPLSATDPTVAATIPAVLAETSANSGLSETELAGVAKLAEEFVAKVTGGSQNPQDPARQQRWAEAQAESDIQMRARYGGHAWLNYHQEAYRQALRNFQTQ